MDTLTTAMPSGEIRTTAYCYANYIDRRDSFKNAPNKLSHIRTMLARLGFYYNRNQFDIVCYHCQLLITNPTSALMVHQIHSKRRYGETICPEVSREMGRRRQEPTLLYTVLRKPPRRVSLEICIQATLRLKHYISYPFMRIHDKEIDGWSVDRDKTRDNYAIHEAYEEIMRQDIYIPYIKRLVDVKSKSPMQWYFKLLHTQMNTNDMTWDSTSFKQIYYHKWTKLPRDISVAFSRLSQMEVKFQTTLRIESLLNVSGFRIGCKDSNVLVFPLNSNTNDNATLVSEMLSTQIQQTFNELLVVI